MNDRVDEIESQLEKALRPGFRNALFEKGVARSMIWEAGVIPAGTAQFHSSLSYDLLSYGYALLSSALQLKDLGGSATLFRKSLGHAATAISIVVTNEEQTNPKKGFHKTVCAASFHLGQFSAKAYALLAPNIEDLNLSLIERSLCLLILRRFDQLLNEITQWKLSGDGSDDTIAQQIDRHLSQIETELESAVEGFDHALDVAVTDNFLSALHQFLLALETGNGQLKDEAIETVKACLVATSDLSMLPHWWILRLSYFLLDDLWATSFHQIIPTSSHDSAKIDVEWETLRSVFIKSHYKRNRSEVTLWPSQIAGAQRSINDNEDLVVLLPTSAGKTRIAELCILRCLSLSQRVLYIAPLRALCAQTEKVLRTSFGPLGKSVSTLYGTLGTNEHEQNNLQSAHILIATPEKLDFTLRNDPRSIDDIGLVVLDEGHMISQEERDVAYEVLIQHLLRRKDAGTRRIVCLSAVVPNGNQLDDFVSWLNKGEHGEAVTSSWRPTDLKFGKVIKKSDQGVPAELIYKVGNYENRIKEFMLPVAPSRPREKIYPKDLQELTIATAWRMAKAGHTVLLFSPQKNWVSGLGKKIVKLYEQNLIRSLRREFSDKLEHKLEFDLAIELGNECFGEGHEIVKCLKIGVAVHHADLPSEFRKQIEKLLQLGIIQLTVCSPTLAQGLNLSATVLVMHSIYRKQGRIQPKEFKNIIGRAGRAFVEMKGVVLLPIFEEVDKDSTKKQSDWEFLIKETNTHHMLSGLIQSVHSLLKRMVASIGNSDLAELSEYVLNNAYDWHLPTVNRENESRTDLAQRNWDAQFVKLDKAILRMLGNNVDESHIREALDHALSSSLWELQLSRYGHELPELFALVLTERARYIWTSSTATQRKGYYLAGIDFINGQRLDAISVEANELLFQAYEATILDDSDLAITKTIQLADIVFSIPTFKPAIGTDNSVWKEKLPQWKKVIKSWMEGKSLHQENLGDIDTVLQFVEADLAYRLTWGLEAIRVRALANGDKVSNSFSLDVLASNFLVPAIEYGTLNRSAIVLMQAGFNFRTAAIHAVTITKATLLDSYDLRSWLTSETVVQHTASSNWPTPATHQSWKDFVEAYLAPQSSCVWTTSKVQVHVTWLVDFDPSNENQMKIWNEDLGSTLVLSSDGERVGSLDARYNLCSKGIYNALVSKDLTHLDLTYHGPNPDPFEQD